MIAKLEAIENFKSVVNEKRWLQGDWHRRKYGKHYLCLAAAFGKPGEITKGLHECPIGVLPQWIFELMPNLDDNIAAADVPWLFKGFAKRLDRMVEFDTATWKRISVDFRVGCIEFALASAHKVQPTPAPAYCRQVENACNRVIAALCGNGDLAAACVVAEEAAEVAEVAEVMMSVEEAEVVSEVAARAAAEAVWTVPGVARLGAQALEAASEVGAWKSIAQLLFRCIDNEL